MLQRYRMALESLLSPVLFSWRTKASHHYGVFGRHQTGSDYRGCPADEKYAIAIQRLFAFISWRNNFFAIISQKAATGGRSLELKPYRHHYVQVSAFQFSHIKVVRIEFIWVVTIVEHLVYAGEINEYAFVAPAEAA